MIGGNIVACPVPAKVLQLCRVEDDAQRACLLLFLVLCYPSFVKAVLDDGSRGLLVVACPLATFLTRIGLIMWCSQRRSSCGSS